MIRKIHLYFGLFLAPWVVMYALSTAAMNHRTFFRPKGSAPPSFQHERTEPYARAFPEGTKPAEMARAILSDLELDGAHTASLSKDGRQLTITRQDPIWLRRIIYTPAARELTIEKQAFAVPAFLERLHRRRGYQHPYALEDAWAFTVDVVIAAILFWSLSGLWLWWEMKKTRKWGAVALIGGGALFTLLLVTI